MLAGNNAMCMVLRHQQAWASFSLYKCRPVNFGSSALLVVIIGFFNSGCYANKRVSLSTQLGNHTTAAADAARTEPSSIRPVVRDLLALSSRQAEFVRQQIQQPTDKAMSVSACYHVLRVHGLDARFPHGKLRSSDAIVRLLTDSESGRRYFGRATMIRTRYGIRFPTDVIEGVEGRLALETHRDQCLAVLGELGFPLSYPLNVNSKTFTLRDVLRDSVANFHLQQQELEWTGLAYALYMPPVREWSNRFGERYSFDSLVEEMLARPLARAACCGTHLLYTLTVLARADIKAPILSDVVRTRVRLRLRNAVAVALQTQRSDGFWVADWHRELNPSIDELSVVVEDSLEERLLVTGHVAEWLMYLPDGLEPSKNVLKRAVIWLYDKLTKATLEEQCDWICPYSHGVCVVRNLMFVPNETTRIANQHVAK